MNSGSINKKMKEVKNIHDIPEIENYLNSSFVLDLYDSSDNTAHYSHKDGEMTITIEIICDSDFFFNNSSLYKILDCNIDYFEWSTCIGKSERLSNYKYRPLLNKQK